MSRRPRPANPFRYFKSLPDEMRLAVLMYGRFSLSLRNVEDLLFDRGKILLQHKQAAAPVVPFRPGRTLRRPQVPRVSRTYCDDRVPSDAA